jgi:hypothetical protein
MSKKWKSRKSFDRYLNRHVSVNNKFVYMDVGSFKIYGEEHGHWKDGVWYSNHGYSKRDVVYRWSKADWDQYDQARGGRRSFVHANSYVAIAEKYEDLCGLCGNEISGYCHRYVLRGDSLCHTCGELNLLPQDLTASENVILEMEDAEAEGMVVDYCNDCEKWYDKTKWHRCDPYFAKASLLAKRSVSPDDRQLEVLINTTEGEKRDSYQIQAATDGKIETTKIMGV